MPNKQPFETREQFDNTSAGSFVLEPTFWDRISVRETVESIAMAIALAMIFKVLQAEAYMIPTGSMAPTLMGQHIEVACDGCGYYFQAGAKDEGPSAQQSRNSARAEAVVGLWAQQVRCPMTFEVRDLERSLFPRSKSPEGQPIESRPNDESFAGDRIVVSKLEYLFRDPERWDVIVFKYPGAAKVNYIKRLVGLPGETLTINNGDVFIQPTDRVDPQLPRAAVIARKPADKLANIAVPVQDSHYFSREMRQAGLPPAWLPTARSANVDEENGWSGRQVTDSRWEIRAADDEPTTYQLDAPEAAGRQYDWLRFRHLVPRQSHWTAVRSGQSLPPEFVDSPGHLVTDYYCYNDVKVVAFNRNWDATRFGGNWVGDLVMEAEVRVGSATGKLALDAVEGGVHFLCEIDVATGQATLSTEISVAGVGVQFADDATLQSFTQPTLSFDTPLRGEGSYRVRYANCDDRIYLWVNDQVVPLPGDGCYSRTGPLHPYCSEQDHGDARPLGIGFQGGRLAIDRLRVFRDLYYLQREDVGPPEQGNSSLRTRTGLVLNQAFLSSFYERPDSWGRQDFVDCFRAYASDNPLNWGNKAYPLVADQFFPMGDNSPQSQDARMWAAPKFVERRLLIGKALMVYWPHSWNSPPYWPNFTRMRMIH
jgi:signal peptidase I